MSNHERSVRVGRKTGWGMDSGIAETRGARPGLIGRMLYLTIGWFAVGLALLGVALPLLPTTPFLLVAAWAFAKGSPRLQAWLYGHPRFGPFLTDWRDQGAIPRRAKLLAVGGMSASWALLAATTANPLVPVFAGAGMAAVAVYVVTRPEPERGD